MLSPPCGLPSERLEAFDPDEATDKPTVLDDLDQPAAVEG